MSRDRLSFEVSKMCIFGEVRALLSGGLTSASVFGLLELIASCDDCQREAITNYVARRLDRLDVPCFKGIHLATLLGAPHLYDPEFMDISGMPIRLNVGIVGQDLGSLFEIMEALGGMAGEGAIHFLGDGNDNADVLERVLSGSIEGCLAVVEPGIQRTRSLCFEPGVIFPRSLNNIRGAYRFDCYEVFLQSDVVIFTVHPTSDDELNWIQRVALSRVTPPRVKYVIIHCRDTGELRIHVREEWAKADILSSLQPEIEHLCRLLLI